MNRTIKQLEKLAYTLERVLEGAREIRKRRRIEQTIAGWKRVCRGCGNEFFPVMKSNIRCVDCQERIVNRKERA